MMSDLDRARALEIIHRNIKQHGFHVYAIEQHSIPRFIYTIGLSDSLGGELVLAGAIYYFGRDALQIVHSIREQLEARLKREKAAAGHLASIVGQTFTVDRLGTFTLRTAHASWSRELLLGAIDYYRGNDVNAFQIVPTAESWTIDVPDMSKEWNAAGEPVWRWLREPWPYEFPETATATTNLAALRGGPVTEVARWETYDWEMFAGPGPNVSRKEMRVVPVTCLVGADPSLAPALDLKVGEGLWRDAGGSWNVWEDSSSGTDRRARWRSPRVLSRLLRLVRGALSKNLS